MKQIRFTKEGFKKMQEEQAKLLQQRPAVIEDLQKARELGDLKENGYYKASRQKLSFIDGRLFRIKMQMKHAIIVTITATDTITIGSTVTLSDKVNEKTYTIVGDLEANPSDGKISLLSPLGRALDGKRIGEIINFETPRGKIIYIITKLK